MRSTRTLIIVSTIFVVGLLGLGTLAQRGEQDRVFERDGTRLYGRLNSVDAVHVVFNGKVIERSQVIMILFPGATVPEASPSSQQSGAAITDLVTMKNGDRSYGKVSRVTASTVVQNGTQLPKTKVGVIEFDVSPPVLIETVEPNEPTPTPPAAPVASPLPPTGYIPGQEKPPGASASPAGEKSPAKNPKNPASKSNCTNLADTNPADLKPAGSECRTAGHVKYTGFVFDTHSGGCACSWSYCGRDDMGYGNWQKGPKFRGDPHPDPKGFTLCQNWALEEKKKFDGKSVCCNCEPVKSK